MMKDREDIITVASGLARRMNIYTTCRYVSLYMLCGAGIDAVIISISKFIIIPIPLLPAVILILALGFLAGFIKGMLTKVSVLEAGMIADERKGLKDRLSTAIEIIKAGGSISAMAELQLEDAANCARTIDLKDISPRIVPKITKGLPFIGAFLLILWLVPSPASIPVEIRKAIKQAGAEIEATAKEVDNSSLSEEVARLISKAESIGRELQDKPMTKREALKAVSSASREVSAWKTIAEVSEKLKGEMTPEKKELLNELLRVLSEELKDIPGMDDLLSKVISAQQADLSIETLRELIKSLESKGLKDSDARALQQMSSQLAKSKQEIGQKILSYARGAGEEETQKIADSTGGGTPGKDSVQGKKKAEPETPRPRFAGGKSAELEGRVSEGGKSIPVESGPAPESRRSVVPYEEIYVKYKDAADDVITRPTIPRIYREHVKSYFDAIKPKTYNP